MARDEDLATYTIMIDRAFVAVVRGMRLAIGIVLFLCAIARAQAVHVDIECEQPGRTKACPAFMLGFLDANKVFLAAPRASADVVIYVSAIEVAQHDRIHLRFASTLAGTPSLVELDTELDTRDDDDTQRAKLEQAFLRGIALDVAARDPDLVTIALGTPHAAETAPKDTTPWDISFGISGNGSWSGPYQTANGSLNASATRTTEKTRFSASAGASGSLNRMPPLVLPDGSKLSTDTTPWSLSAGLGGAYLFDDHWSASGSLSASHGDPHSVTRDALTPSAGLQWDKYKANDPRGNKLSIGYSASLQLETYNLPDTLGETSAHYVTHSLFASGSVRKDKTDYGLSVGIGGELLHPERRYTLSASPSVTWKLGGHVDLSVSASVTKREVVGPDPRAIDMTSYAAISNLSYTEPLSVTGSVGLTIHWDRTNGARNDR